MPNEHYIMTLQPGIDTESYDQKAGNPITISGNMETDGMTSDEVFKSVFRVARNTLQRNTPYAGSRHPIILGSSVLFYSREIAEE